VQSAISALNHSCAAVIPPRATSTADPALGMSASRRAVHVHTVAALGRLGWQEVTGYGRRVLVETTMGRYKALVGTRLRARNEAGRRTEAAVSAVVPNRMLAAGQPNSVHTVRDANQGRGGRELLVPLRLPATTPVGTHWLDLVKRADSGCTDRRSTSKPARAPCSHDRMFAR
jgi:hypothetical protein